jgi:hypothetical protein
MREDERPVDCRTFSIAHHPMLVRDPIEGLLWVEPPRSEATARGLECCAFISCSGYLGKKCCPPLRLGAKRSKPYCRQRQLLHPQPTRTNLPRRALYHDHCRSLLENQRRLSVADRARTNLSRHAVMSLRSRTFIIRAQRSLRSSTGMLSPARWPAPYPRCQKG